MWFGRGGKQREREEEALLVSQANVRAEEAAMSRKFADALMQSLLDVNGLLQYMTGLTYVKEMILEAGEQAETVESVAAGSEEMSAATSDISNFVQNASHRMTEAMSAANDSLNRIDSTFSELDRNIEQTQSVRDTMRLVTKETERINEMVNVIKAVADQTNLLALNASIEAARAGESGRGFAVVANEIKKLADSSSSQVGSIQDIVSALNDRIEKASTEIEHVISRFEKSKSSMDAAMGGIKGIHDTMGFVGDSFNEISANVQEQTAATEEITSKIMVISDKSADLSKKASRTGEAFFELSQKLDDIRLRIHSCQDGCPAAVMIELSISDHMMWKWRVYNMLLGYVRLSADKAADHTGCRLGKWLATLDKTNPKVAESLSRIRQPHEKLHAAASKAVLEHAKGNMAGAEQLLKEIESHSLQVVEQLRALKVILA